MRQRVSWIATVAITLLLQVFLALNGSSARLRDLTASFSQQEHTGRNEIVSTQNRENPSSKLTSYNDTLSICLLTKDDAHILPEWLAYHYHVANLRTLIVVVDPTSKTHPKHIFDRFQNLLDLEIIEWKDSEIMPKNLLNANGTLDAHKVAGYRKRHLPPIKNKWLRNQVISKYLNENATESEIQTTMLKLGVHRYRQEQLATTCVNHLHDTKRGWVSILDSDEYIRIADSSGNTSMYKPGSVMKWINTVYSNETACVKMVWFRYGSTKEVSETRLRASAPHQFDAKQFLTLRWGYHDNAENNGKDLLHVGRASSKHFPLPKITNIHALANPICGSSYKETTSHPIVIGHYTGTWEQYSTRDDVRRSNARRDFEKKASAAAIEDDDNSVASWFGGFIAVNGIDKTRQLLGESYLAK